MERVLPDLDDFRHWLPVQLRFNDIDILGHLNNIVYFSLYDLAKAMFIQSLRKEQIYWRKVDCVIANIDCAYIHPIYFGDQMEVATRCIHIGDRSFTLEQCLVEKSSRQIRSICTTVMVCFDPDTGKSAPMNESLRSALSAHYKDAAGREP